MIFWIDAQLTPLLARWLQDEFGVVAYAVRDLGLRDAKDKQIFEAARDAGAVVITKDSDFVELVMRFGTPPQVLWLTCGNTSNKRLRQIFQTKFAEALELLKQSEPVVEISDALE